MSTYKRAGYSNERGAFAISLIYAFKHFRGQGARFVIDIGEFAEGAVIEQDFSVLSAPTGTEHAVSAVLDGEIKSVFEVTPKNYRDQIRRGVDKLRQCSSPHRMLVLPFRGIVPSIRESIAASLSLDAGAINEQEGKAGESDDSAILVRTLRAMTAGVNWMILAYDIAHIDLALSMALIERDFSTVAAHSRLGAFVFEEICEEKIDRLQARLCTEIPLETSELLPGDRIPEEAKLSLLLGDPWASLAEDYLGAAGKVLSRIERWTQVFSDALVQSTPRSLARAPRRISPMDPAYAIERRDAEGGRSLGVRIATEVATWPPITVIEAPSGAGKSVSLERLASTLCQALLLSGGSLGLSFLPLHVDLRRLTPRSIAGYSSEQAEDGAGLDGVGIETLARLFGSWLELEDVHDRSADIVTLAKERRCMTALFCRFPLMLLIDGYDHLVALGKTEMWRPLLSNLQRQGVRVARVLVTSRPGHRVHGAFDWVLPGVSSDSLKPTSMTIGALQTHEQEAYVDRWVRYARDIGEPNASLRSFAGYVDWLTKISTPEPGLLGPIAAREVRGLQDLRSRIMTLVHEGRSSLPSSCRSNALLFNLSVLAYLSSGAGGAPRRWLCEGDVIEGILARFDRHRILSAEPVPEAPHERQRPIVETMSGVAAANFERQGAVREWLELLSFDLLCRSERQLGAADDATCFSYRIGDEVVEATVEEWCNDARGASLRSGELLICRYLVGSPEKGIRGRIEFEHASFQEYLAGIYLARAFIGVGPGETQRVAGERASSEPIFDLEGGIREEAIRTLERTLQLLGPRPFKHFLGQLLVTARHGGRNFAPARCFFAILARSFALQQFLYDAAYLDESLVELAGLVNVVVEDGHKAELAVALKVLGHLFYGNPDKATVAIGIDLMKASLECLGGLKRDSMPAAPKTQLRVFLLDHVLNREDSLAQDERLKKENSIARLVPSSLRRAPTSKKAPLIMRAAHFWGHVGNHRLSSLRAMFSAWRSGREFPSLANSKFNEAEHLFWRAALYRARCLKSLDRRLHDELVLPQLANIQQPPSWYGSDEPTESTIFETGLSVSQSVGDIANQVSCIAQVRLWAYVARREATSSRKRRALDRAKAAAAVAVSLWNSAMDAHDQHGAPMIKYYIWLPATELGIEVAERHQKKGRLNGIADIVERRIDEAQTRAGIRYDIAKSGVLATLLTIDRCLNG